MTHGVNYVRLQEKELLKEIENICKDKISKHDNLIAK